MEEGALEVRPGEQARVRRVGNGDGLDDELVEEDAELDEDAVVLFLLSDADIVQPAVQRTGATGLSALGVEP